LTKQIDEIYQEYILEEEHVHHIDSVALDDEEQNPNLLYDYAKKFATTVAIDRKKDPLFKNIDFQITNLDTSKKLYITWWDWDKNLIFETIPFYGSEEKMLIKAKTTMGVEDDKAYVDSIYGERVIPFQKYDNTRAQSELYLSLMRVVMTNVTRRYLNFIDNGYKIPLNEAWEDIDSAKLDDEESKTLPNITRENIIKHIKSVSGKWAIDGWVVNYIGDNKMVWSHPKYKIHIQIFIDEGSSANRVVPKVYKKHEDNSATFFGAYMSCRTVDEFIEKMESDMGVHHLGKMFNKTHITGSVYEGWDDIDSAKLDDEEDKSNKKPEKVFTNDDMLGLIMRNINGAINRSWIDAPSMNGWEVEYNWNTPTYNTSSRRFLYLRKDGWEIFFSALPINQTVNPLSAEYTGVMDYHFYSALLKDDVHYGNGLFSKRCNTGGAVGENHKIFSQLLTRVLNNAKKQISEGWEDIDSAKLDDEENITTPGQQTLENYVDGLGEPLNILTKIPSGWKHLTREERLQSANPHIVTFINGKDKIIIEPWVTDDLNLHDDSLASEGVYQFFGRIKINNRVTFVNGNEHWSSDSPLDSIFGIYRRFYLKVMRKLFELSEAWEDIDSDALDDEEQIIPKGQPRRTLTHTTNKQMLNQITSRMIRHYLERSEFFKDWNRNFLEVNNLHYIELSNHEVVVKIRPLSLSPLDELAFVDGNFNFLAQVYIDSDDEYDSYVGDNLDFGNNYHVIGDSLIRMLDNDVRRIVEEYTDIGLQEGWEDIDSGMLDDEENVKRVENGITIREFTTDITNRVLNDIRQQHADNWNITINDNNITLSNDKNTITINLWDTDNSGGSRGVDDDTVFDFLLTTFNELGKELSALFTGSFNVNTEYERISELCLNVLNNRVLSRIAE